MTTTINGTGNIAVEDNRIKGDFSNATIGNRVMFQTSTTNGSSNLAIIPNGTGVQSSIGAFNSSDPGNASTASLLVNGVEARFSAGQLGTGSYLPMTFYTGGSERMRIDVSGNALFGVGNFGIGTAGIPIKKLEINSTGGNAAIRLKETATYGVNWDIDVGTANAMRFYNGAGSALSYEFYNGAVLQMSPNGLGYGTGAGGTVTQATSKTTAVTLNKPTGVINMNNAALAAGASATFFFNNSVMALTDCLITNISRSSGANPDAYRVVNTVGTGGGTITVTNVSGGSLSEVVVINFAIIKGATA